MSHQRTEIRAAVAKALKGQTDVGQNVFTSIHRALFAETYPCIAISSPEEPVESGQGQPAKYFRTLTLIVSGIVQVNEEIDTALDTLAKQIETVMGQSPSIFGASGMVLKGTSETVVQGEDQFGGVHLTYEASYYG